MSIPKDLNLYNKVKEIVFKQYDKPSAYRSGALVKEYKKEFKNKYGENDEPYIGEKTKDGLTRWYKENWKDIGNMEYPVYRPTKRISKLTPLLVSEIDEKDLKKKILLKQKIKDKKNLEPFKKKIIYI